MKYLYQCERCGRTFENYDEAKECEKSHLDMYVGYHEFGSEMAQFTKWNEGDTLPRELVLATEVPRGHESDEEPACDFGVYEFKRRLRQSELELVKSEHAARNAKEREWYEKFKIEKAAKDEAEGKTE